MASHSLAVTARRGSKSDSGLLNQDMWLNGGSEIWGLRCLSKRMSEWGLLIRKQLEAIPHRHENSMHLPCESQTDWRGCDAGSVPITQWAKCAEWLTMIKCKRGCECHSPKHISYVSVCRRVGQSLSIKKDRMNTRPLSFTDIITLDQITVQQSPLMFSLQHC